VPWGDLVDVEFASKELVQLEAEKDFKGGFPAGAVRGFRKVMQLIRAAMDERDFAAMRSLHFEKLKGNRSCEWSMRLNKQWRLILQIKEAKPKNVIRIIAIDDYH
jgi:proteic killer suppression protein